MCVYSVSYLNILFYRKQVMEKLSKIINICSGRKWEGRTDWVNCVKITAQKHNYFHLS